MQPLKPFSCQGFRFVFIKNLDFSGEIFPGFFIFNATKSI